MAPRSGRVNPQVQTRGAARSFVETLDTYYQPERDTRRENALQRGLSSFGSMFEQQAAQEQEDRREGYYKQGQLDSYAEQAGEELTGVRQGNILRQNSRFYEMGLNEGRGSAAGIKWKNDLAVEFAQSGIDAQKNPEAFRQWMDEKTNEFLSQFEGNPYAIDGAMPHVNEAVQNLSSQYSANLNDRLHQERIDIFDQEISDLWDGDIRGDYDRETTLNNMIELREELFATEGPAANGAMIQAAIRHGVERGDATAILLMLEHRGKDGLNLSKQEQAALGDGLDTVEAEIARRQQTLTEQQEAEQERILAHAEETLMDAYEENPYLDLRKFYDEYIKTYAGGVPQGWLFKDLEEMQSILRQSRKQAQPPSSELKLNYEIEMGQAESREERMEIMRRYSSQGVDVTKDLKGNQAYDEYMSSDLNKTRQSTLIDGFRKLESGSEFMMEGQEGAISILAERMYAEAINELASQYSGAELHREASKLVGEEIYARFGQNEGFRENLMQNQPLVDLLGLAQPLQREAQAAEEKREQQRVQLQRNDMNAGLADAAQNPDVGGGGTLEPQSVEERDNPSARPVTPGGAMTGSDEKVDPLEVPEEEPYPEIADRFYAEQLARLTDGKDDRVSSKDYQEILNEDSDFAVAVTTLAQDLGVDPQGILAVMDFETGGTFDPTVENAAGSGATGLIQFMPATARGLGTTTEQLARMSRAEQMIYVRKYFEQFSNDLSGGDVDDLYMTVLYPKAVGKPDGYVLFRSGTTAYSQNRGLDIRSDAKG